eukprot:TRINITY_DN5478_c0_g1_i1.p1 TRINITY_DN5478_c0_g1~~TRINITY_DN5478_c0_g1_i1.p1  ORF type:complete len:487 (-),score=91.91 TRINITY_DN5478_c0_g1_i1:72-1532(-)
MASPHETSESNSPTPIPHLPFQHSDISQKKTELILAIELQRKAIQDYDKTHDGVKSTDQFDFQEYDTMTSKFDELRKELDDLRLEGDEFQVRYNKEPRILVITTWPQSKIIVCNITRTAQHPHESPVDISKYDVYRVKCEEDEQQFVVIYSEWVQYIHDLRRVYRPLNPVRGTETNIYLEWFGKTTKDVVDCQNSFEIEEVLASHMKAFKYARLAQILRLKELWNSKKTSFNSEKSHHESMLDRLWSSAFPNQVLDKRISPLWKQLGFQGNDPATDFRGMGLLGLHNLVYFAEKHPLQLRYILSQFRDYPVATAGINLTSLLLDLLHITKDVADLPATSRDWNSEMVLFLVRCNDFFAYEELYCLCFLLLDSLWERSSASYMEFPVVFARLKQKLESYFKKRPVSILELKSWLDEEGLLAKVPSYVPISSPRGTVLEDKGFRSMTGKGYYGVYSLEGLIDSHSVTDVVISGSWESLSPRSPHAART